MLNYFVFGLILLSLIMGAINGKIADVTNAAIQSAKSAVELAFGLIGIMTLWLGLMKIAEESGLVRLLARIIRPITGWLFPDLPPDHPAIGSMLMNIVANWLGLANAATPLGLKSMQELQEANPHKDTASNAMAIFLALNTATICIIPMTIIAIRSSAGAKNPTEIIAPTILASICATIVAVATAKLLSRVPVFKKEINKNNNNEVDGNG